MATYNHLLVPVSDVKRNISVEGMFANYPKPWPSTPSHEESMTTPEVAIEMEDGGWHDLQ
jgi:tRNA G46 methylase TrmB